MDHTDVLIVGGSAAGITAAIAARQDQEDARITLIRKEKQAVVPCGIPYIFGTLMSPEKNVISDSLLSKSNIELVIDEVTSVDGENKSVATSGGMSLGYERLVLATGSVAVVPPIRGVGLEGVFTVKKDIQYLKCLSEAVEQAHSALVVGGGFVGIEFADEFTRRGLKVTVVEMLPHCLQLVYEEEFCILAERKLSEKGVRVRTNDGVEAIMDDGNGLRARLRTGEELQVDLVLIAAGVEPNVDLAKHAGLRIGPRGGVWVDEYMRTSDPCIFAVGDCAEKTSFFTKKPVALRLASVAAREARIAAANLFSLKMRNEGAIGTFSTVVGQFSLCAVGLSEKAAKEAMYEPVTGASAGPDKHPSSMPNASEMNVKLVFDKATGQILGGQVFGGQTSGEVANILAAMIQKRMTIDEIVAFQIGTHPALTGSPIAYQIVNAAVDARGRAATSRPAGPTQVPA